MAEARRLGFAVSIITNGFRLAALLDAQADDLDWVGLSVDSADEATQAALGRGRVRSLIPHGRGAGYGRGGQ